MRAAITCRNLRGKTGVSRIVIEHILHLSNMGAQVDVYGDKLDKNLIRAPGGEAFRLARLPIGRDMARRFFSYRFDQLNRHKKYDLVISNGELLNADINFVHNLTSLESELVPSRVSKGMQAKINFDRQIFGKEEFKICIANSDLVKNELIKRHGSSNKKIHTVYPGFDPIIYSTNNHEQIRTQHRENICGTEKFLIGFITSGHFIKRGADILLKTLSGLDKELLDNVAVLAIGDKRNLSWLQKEFSKAGLGSSLIKRTKTNKLARYYHSIDLLFHPARIEEFGLVIAEASGCGTPVLSSRMTGATEIFVKNGIDMPENPDPEEFLPHLTELISNPEHRLDLARRQNESFKGYTWTNYFNELFRLYKEQQLINW